MSDMPRNGRWPLPSGSIQPLSLRKSYYTNPSPVESSLWVGITWERDSQYCSSC